MDFAEQVESVAYVICGEELITFDKFCQIWHVKGVSRLAHQSLNRRQFCHLIHELMRLFPITDLGQIVSLNRCRVCKSSVDESDYGVHFQYHQFPTQVRL